MLLSWFLSFHLGYVREDLVLRIHTKVFRSKGTLHLQFTVNVHVCVCVCVCLCVCVCIWVREIEWQNKCNKMLTSGESEWTIWGSSVQFLQLFFIWNYQNKKVRREKSTDQPKAFLLNFFFFFLTLWSFWSPDLDTKLKWWVKEFSELLIPICWDSTYALGGCWLLWKLLWK